MTQSLVRDERLTFDEFERMGDAAHGYELVDGHLVERRMSHLADYTSMRMGRFIGQYFDDRPIGHVFGSESMYRLGLKNAARNARKPDVSVLLKEQLPKGRLPRLGFRGRPTLAFESVSPTDVVTELEQKLQEYLAAGVPLIWVAYPELRMGRVVRPGEPFVVVPEDGGAFDGGDVLPGLRVPLADVLPPVELMPGAEAPEDSSGGGTTPHS